MNPKNKDNKFFQYAVTVALNYEEIKWNREVFLNIKPFINKCKWKGINYPSKIDDWKTFEKNNLTIAPNILYIKEVFCILKKKKYIQLMFQKLVRIVKKKSLDDPNQRNLAVKKLSVLQRRITTKLLLALP